MQKINAYVITTQDVEYIKKLINETEPADVAPVIHAHWIFYANGTCDCSNCHTVWDSNMVNRWIEYCPFCGAKMDEEVKS